VAVNIYNLGTSRLLADDESTPDFFISYIKWTVEFEIDIGKALEMCRRPHRKDKIYIINE
jgi:hypothetical protein